MEFEFECDCGATVSELMRGSNAEITATVRCDDCGANYAITITAFGTHETE